MHTDRTAVALLAALVVAGAVGPVLAFSASDGGQQAADGTTAVLQQVTVEQPTFSDAAVEDASIERLVVQDVRVENESSREAFDEQVVLSEVRLERFDLSSMDLTQVDAQGDTGWLENASEREDAALDVENLTIESMRVDRMVVEDLTIEENRVEEPAGFIGWFVQAAGDDEDVIDQTPTVVAATATPTEEDELEETRPRRKRTS